MDIKNLINWATSEREKAALSALESIVRPMYIKDMPKVMESVTALSFIITGAEMLLKKETEKIELELGLIKGETCNRNGCTGIIDEHKTDTSCSCHINPPCSHCVDDRNYCPKCNWQGADE